MADPISLRTLVKYEALFPGKNALDLFKKEDRTVTDLRDMVFCIMHTKDSSVTLETVDNLSVDEFKQQLAGFSVKKDAEAK